MKTGAQKGTVSSDGFDEPVESGSSYVTPPFDEPLELVASAVADAAMDELSWPSRIRVGLVALLACLDGDERCRGLVLDTAAGDATRRECIRRVQRALAPVLEEARGEIIIGSEIRPRPGLIAELVTLAALSVIRSRILRGDGAPLAELEPSLMLHVVEPYLGRGAERADRAGAEVPRSRAEMVPIRPHPRTIEALRVIASAPRLSTREVGREVGIENNSGHISMLLHRLEQRGLIENASHGQTERQAHTWFLTPYGARVLEVLGHSFRAASLGERNHAAVGRAPLRPGPLQGLDAGRVA